MHTVKIGIPLGMKDSSFSRVPHYAMEQNYFDAVAQLGALPVPLIYNEETLEDYLNMVDGVLIPGGSFASPVSWYEEDIPELEEATAWSDFYKKITAICLQKNIPVLGICAGMQFLACVSGGKMTVNVQEKTQTTVDHLNGAPKEEYAHKVTVHKDSLLYRITGEEVFQVNSAHTEAVTQVANNTTVSAWCTEDKCIEAIEIKNHPFALGVQWHPEFFINNPYSPHYKIMKAFIDAARK